MQIDMTLENHVASFFLALANSRKITIFHNILLHQNCPGYCGYSDKAIHLMLFHIEMIVVCNSMFQMFSIDFGTQ